MDYEFYGLSKENYHAIITRRSDYVHDYWRKGRHFTRHNTKDPGLASRVADKNVYDNLLRTFYDSNTRLPSPQGVFYGYGYNEFTRIHLHNRYLLKIDLKCCFRNIKFSHFHTIITKHTERLAFPLPEDLVRALYFPHGYLQAGLTASNIISDLVIKYSFDKAINKKMHEHGVTDTQFSRYYDDFYISSNDKGELLDIRSLIKSLSKEQDLPINYGKLYIGALNGTQILKSTIADGEVRVSRKHKNNLRAAIWKFESISPEDTRYEGELRSIVSRLRHICTVEKIPNQKYVNEYENFKTLLKEFTEG